MMGSVELTASLGFGGGKPWIARITGTDTKFGLAREFLASRLSTSKSGKTGTVTAIVTTPGLYECCSTDDKGKTSKFRLIVDHEGELRNLALKETTAYELATAMEAGKTLRDLVIWPGKDEGSHSVRDREGQLVWRTSAPTPPAPAPIDLSGVATEDLLAELRRRGVTP